MTFKVYSIVPVKGTLLGKSRLLSVLSDNIRRKLVILMFKDVITSLKESKFLSGIIVVSPDDKILNLSRKYGCIAIKEKPKSLGLNRAVKLGVNAAIARHADAVLIVSADVPLVTREDIDYIISIGYDLSKNQPYMIIAPSKDGGTNILMLSLPSSFTFKYGFHSCKKHLAEAIKLGLKTIIVYNERISLDLDKKEDIEFIIKSCTDKETVKFLRSVL